jgi:hypothetical protein
MREHELELIAALAEGRLEDETDARALLASSEEARAEFEAQVSALTALSATSPVMMSPTERAGLHRDIWTELHSPMPVPSTPSSKPWYYRWMPVAAGMFVLVGLVAVLSQDGLETFVAADEGAAVTTSLASSETTDAVAEELDGGDDSGGGEAGGETVTESPTNTVAEAGDGDASAQAPPAAAAFYSAEADELREDEESRSLQLGGLSTTELADCLERAGLDGYEVREANPTPDDQGDPDADVPEEAVPYLAAIPSGEELATAEVVFGALETCEVIHVDR